MSKDWHRRLEELFHQAADLDGDARERFLAEHCGDDDELRRELVALLALDRRQTLSLLRNLAMEGEGQPGAASDPAPPGPSHDPARGRFDGAEASLPSGLQIEQYEVIRLLGRGGMGEVYLARDTRLGRLVAIKFLHSDARQVTERFVIEARATARCSHENIVVIHEVDEHEGKPFMVLEYLEGQPLSRLMRSCPLPVARAVELVIPVVRALVCAHDLGIVHRDLKPDNIFVTDSGVVKVLDFGIAKVLSEQQANLVSLIHESQVRGDEPTARAHGPVAAGLAVDGLVGASRPDAAPGDSPLSLAGMLIGTMPYMAPEQWNGLVDDVDERTDLWAVGIMLFEMVVGEHPLYPLRGEQLVVTGALHQPMPRVRDAGFDGPEALAQLIDRCLAKPRHDRPGGAEEVLAVLESLLPGWRGRQLDADQSPYPGLVAFQEADADRYFGRSGDVASMLARLDRHPLMGVVGPSGIGKSSFVRAGVVPALKRRGEHLEALIVRPGQDPLASLASALLPLLSSTPESPGASRHQALTRRLRSEPGYAGAVLRRRARRAGSKVLLFVDQFEELYTLVHSSGERTVFCNCLTGVADDPSSPLRVVIAIRSDFVDRVAENRLFSRALIPGLLFLPAPERDGLREALIQPAHMAGYRFETTETVDDMVDKLDTMPGALPLLQFAMTKLWDMRDQQAKILREDSYHELGGVGGALASHADAVLNALPPREQDLVRVIFERLVTPERTRAVVSVAELRELADEPGAIERLMEHLVNARLLVVRAEHVGGGATDDSGVSGGPGDSGDAVASGTSSDNIDLLASDGASVELIHEAMILSWPRLAHWVDEHREDAVFLQQLRAVARQWQDKGHPRGLLWRGESVEEARRWHRRYRGPITRLEQQYLDAVMAMDDLATRRKKQLVAGAMALLVVLVIAATVALVRIHRAEQETQRKAAVIQEQLDEIRRAQDLADSAMNAEKMTRGQLINALAGAREERSKAEDARNTAEDARREAEKARDESRRREVEAQAARDAARSAQAEAERAKDDLARLLEAEQRRVRAHEKRIEELEKKRGQAAGGTLE